MNRTLVWILGALAAVLIGLLVWRGMTPQGNASTPPAASEPLSPSPSPQPSPPASSESAEDGASIRLTGAGSSFSYPLYTRMFQAYHEARGVQVNYQSIGSSGGQRQLLAQTVDFAGTDAPVSEETEQEIPDGNAIVHIPTELGAIVVIYNLEGLSEPLTFDGPTLARIFLGEIQNWNDPAIAALNEGATLPDLPITVVHRSDGSGSSFVFTDYLSSVSSEWESRVGRDTAPNWPVGLGGKGNEGIAGIVSQTPGAIGYVELIYSLQNDIPNARIVNASGNAVAATLESVNAAAAGVEIPADARVSIVNTPAENGYPIATYSWMILYRDQDYSGRSREHAQALVDLAAWMISEGQQYTEPLDYARLPQNAVDRGIELLRTVNYAGEALYRENSPAASP
ncbi:phosphate transport system substrate-binding protein [Deinobacterium chartae]|uniref:Phosphate-binding protein n=1 Tax=Deinobacterium chartae TaxID=521158 RepID=A0A841HVL9_9DEIO|nr:phosphate ABC transporter substrate-binding protein PstS [Deinobacterium chartae]MBB6096966.1 phosphate transport system substrate-binding protein [Deinobacterium chartae]